MTEIVSIQIFEIALKLIKIFFLISNSWYLHNVICINLILMYIDLML